MSPSNIKLWKERGPEGRSIIILVDVKSMQEETVDSSLSHELPIVMLKDKLEEVKVDRLYMYLQKYCL